ncbi:MAG: alpha/beta hydrolase [Proteobacteria bacterium]|nr:alpha/beta hydrolase [Pseudomonadota bacterium]
MVSLSRRAFAASAVAFAATPVFAGEIGPPAFKAADTGDGIRLHYVEQGSGPPLIFVHGSLSDYTYWKPQFPFFTRDHRVIAYSRRYNWPNSNAPWPGYSAVTDADDLARFIAALGLKNPVIVGHSYGALTALFFAVRHPGIAPALVLAEPPAMSLLNHIQGADAAKGRALFADVQARMVAPMRAAFAKGEREKGVGVFIDYVFGRKDAWANFSPQDRADTMKDAHEWDVMMTKGTLFPDLPPGAVRDIHVPVLMLSGANSYPFLALTDAELARLLPDVQHVVVPGVGHQMWLQRGDVCRARTAEFLQRLKLE